MAENILIPQNYMTHIYYTKSHRDDMAFMWLNRIQGKYKGVAVIKRLKKIKSK